MAETTPTPTPEPVAPPEVAASGPTPADAPAVPTAAPVNPAIADMNRNYQQQQDATAQLQKDTAPTPPAAPVPHARLLAMISGLATGLGAFGTSLATKGAEGGVKEVEQVQSEEQNRQIQAQQAAQAQKSAKVQQDLMVLGNLRDLANSTHLLATMPDEIAKSHLETTGMAQTQAITGADFQASHGGMKPEEFSTALSDSAPLSGNKSVNPFFVMSAQQTLQAAKTSGLPDTDQFVQRLQGVLSDPKSTAKDVYLATQQLQTQRGLQKEATTEKTAREAAAAASPVGKLSTPEALAAPGAQAAIQSKIDDPNTDPTDISRLRALLPQAAVAQFNAENIKQRELRNQQLVNQGSAEDAGKLLANRTLTLPELKARSVTSKFIQDAVAAATKYDPNFKAPEAEAQARIAAAPANSQFFGNTDSLLVHGGTLDQLAQAHAALGNKSLPFANKIDNWRKAALGQGPQAAFAAAALGVADDGSKVMAGGTGSDASRQQFLDIIGRDLNNAGMAASLEQIRKQVTSQRNGRISTNPYLRDMYPDPSTRQETAGVAGTQPADHHVIAIGNEQYQYNGSGDTADLKNYTKIVKK